MISHDVRTPLNGIMGNIDLLKSHQFSPAEQQRLDAIGVCSDTLCTLFNDILDFHKFRKNDIPLDIQPTHLRKLVDEVSQWIYQRSDLFNVKISQVIADDLPDFIMTDHVRLRQILLNVMSNAARYGGGKPVTVQVGKGVGPSPDNRAMLCFHILDKGPGIPADDLERIFDPYVQLRDGNKVTGSGLGLAIVRMLAEAMDGYAAIATELGRGTTVTIGVPLQPASADAQPASLSPSTQQRLRRSHVPGDQLPHVLVVDDVKINRSLLSSMLEEVGLTSSCAADANEVYALCENNAFDVILMDLHMPDEDGATVAEKIRAGGLNQDTPIVIITGDQFPETIERCRAAGVDKCLSKPLRMQTLVDELKALGFLADSVEE